MAVLVYSQMSWGDVTTTRSHTHGNAGDPLRTFFSEARVMAEDRVRSLKLCEMKSSTNEAKAKWLVSVKEKLADDIKNSKHVWLSDFQGSCAFTQFDQKNAPVYLSYPECRSIDGDHKAAMELLIHESLHHIGIEQEVEAELYAAMVMDADQLDECPVQPYDPFDSKTCEGNKISKTDILKYFQPGANSTSKIGESKTVARYRRCNALTGCADWNSRKKIFEWKAPNTSAQKVMINEADLEKDFSFYIAEYSGPSFGIRTGIKNFKCTIKPKQGQPFRCDARYVQKVGRYNQTFQPTDPHTKRIMNFGGSTKSDSLTQTMKFNQSCFWMKARTVGEKSGNGDYYESELVIYSHF